MQGDPSNRGPPAPSRGPSNRGPPAPAAARPTADRRPAPPPYRRAAAANSAARIGSTGAGSPVNRVNWRKAW